MIFHVHYDVKWLIIFQITGEAFEGIIPGHEICGVVEELGKEAELNTSLKIGESLGFVLVYVCFELYSLIPGNKLCFGTI